MVKTRSDVHFALIVAHRRRLFVWKERVNSWYPLPIMLPCLDLSVEISPLNHRRFLLSGCNVAFRIPCLEYGFLGTVFGRIVRHYTRGVYAKLSLQVFYHEVFDSELVEQQN